MSDAERAGTAPIPAEEPEEAQSPGAGTNDDESPGSETDEGLVAKLRKEAAGHRTRAKEAETRAESAEARADVLGAVVLESALRGTNVTPELFAAAGHDLDEFLGPDGLDTMALYRAARETSTKFGVRRGSPYTGTGGERPTSRTWDDVLKKD